MADDDNPFEEQTRSKLRRALQADSYSALANTLFGDLVDQSDETFEDMRADLTHAGIRTLHRTYVSTMILTTVLAFIVTLTASIGIFAVLKPPMVFVILTTFSLPLLASTLVFTLLYVYPSHRAKQRRKDIDNNLPFALNQMSAVASSGIPPSQMFNLLTDFEEYGEIARAADKIVKKVEVFGDDITTALRDVARDTPSENLTEILYGMISTIETGGSLSEFLDEQAASQLFEYRLRQERQIQNISAYASFYTALLIAAPLFLVAVLAIMNIVGGNVLGFAIEDIMWAGVYIGIPAVNILFIIFLSSTQEAL